MDSIKSQLIIVFNILKKHLPTKRRVTLRREVLNDDGLCFPPDDEDSEIKIIIDKSRCEQIQIESLLHEYTHALVIDTGDESSLHTKKWGITYARVYTIYLEKYIYGEDKRKTRKSKS